VESPPSAPPVAPPVPPLQPLGGWAAGRGPPRANLKQRSCSEGRVVPPNGQPGGLRRRLSSSRAHELEAAAATSAAAAGASSSSSGGMHSLLARCGSEGRRCSEALLTMARSGVESLREASCSGSRRAPPEPHPALAGGRRGSTSKELLLRTLQGGGAAGSSSKEARLRASLTADADVEALMRTLRAEEGEVRELMLRQAAWEARHPLAATLVLVPEGKGLAWWDLLMLAFVALFSVLMPLDVAFGNLLDRSATVGGFMACLDVCFLIDFGLGFRTAYPHASARATLVKLPWMIAWHYLRSTIFWVDLTCALPFYLWIRFSGLSEIYWWIDLLKLTRILRLLKLPYLLGRNKKWQKLRLIVHPSVISLGAGLASLLYLLHLVGCVYVVVVRREVDDYLAMHSPLSADELHDEAANEWWPPRDFLGVGGSGDRAELTADTYLWAFWWALCMMVGEPFTPHTPAETAFSMVILLAGFLASAYVIGTCTTALSELSASTNFERQKRDYVDQYLRYRKIPTALRKHIAQFYQFAGFGAESERQLAELPATLQLQLDLVFHRDLFLQVPFFKSCTVAELMQVVPRIRREYAWPVT